MANPIKIIYEDNHLLVVNKPAGILVQGDKTGDIPLVDIAKDYVKRKYNKPGAVFLGVVHRLDRPVSGLVIFARTSKALERMNAQLKNKEIKKTYWAIVNHQPPVEEDRLTHWLIKDTQKNITKAYDREKKGSLKAILDYKLLGRIGHEYILQVNPLTGRPHQIRVQLAKMGCSIVGDLKYGHDKANRDASIMLHARSLSFVHPVRKEKMRFDAAPPEMQKWKPFKGF
ncbi:RluA family pseudouridine synthase [Fulvivirgaceae bacterium BMA10]|uniref:RluA family pseudouridine synthase n=1 Tax=Splendidivirga corallicola TaxID=3051826 RepID=A0ABT8KW00_9BACT|nr:RluA family pseudouridine synthase [Fulvivirgaceae bacterium BMA10]